MTYEERKKALYEEMQTEILGLAEYLGANGPEMWCEVHRLLDKFEEGLMSGQKDLHVMDFTCDKHGSVKPFPTCPKCTTIVIG